MSKDIDKCVTYQQYRDAAYRYNAVSEKVRREKKEYEQAREDYLGKKNEREQLEKIISENRTKRNEIYEQEIIIHKKQWMEQREAFDRQINEEIEQIKSEAQNKIRKIMEDYVKQSSGLDNKLRPYYNQVTKYEREIEDLYEEKNNIGDLTAEVPVANKKVQAFLRRAKKKKLLSSKQYEFIESSCDSVIGGQKNFTMPEDVKNAEKTFAESEWYKRLEKGDVTESVKIKAANAVSGGVIIVFLLLLFVFFIADMKNAENIFLVIVMMLAFGGVTANIFSFVFIKMFFDDLDENRRNNAVFASVIVGMAAGMGIRMTMYNTSVGAGIIMIIFSLVSVFFLFRKSMIAFVGLDTLGKLELMRDFSRKEIFREKTGGKDNPYLLQMYCYCNHNAVIDYMIMNYRDNIYYVISEKLEIAQNCLKVASRELSMHKEDLNRLRSMKDRRTRSIRQVKLELDIAIKEAEKKRLCAPPNFDELLSDDALYDINILDNEYATLEKQKETLDEQVNKSDERMLKTGIRSSAAEEKLKQTIKTLREWDLSPTPRATDFELSDLFCFESNNNISIVKHNLEPFVFRYCSKDENCSPAKFLNKAICRCIKGMKKINPKALFQINIVDTVSSREDILGYHGYEELSDDGIITYVKTADKYEIRLIDSKSGYKMIRALFNSQCYDIRDYLYENKDKWSSETEMSLSGANRLKNSEDEPFVYQIMMYIVPREYDNTNFAPPEELVRIMRDDACVNMGMVPFFFADKNSVKAEWEEALSLCRWSCTIGIESKRKNN